MDTITSSLREWAKGYWPVCTTMREHVLDMADRIDEAHKKECAVACAEGANLASGNIEDEAEELGYVKLPVDADGVPIRLGDTVRWGGTGEPFAVNEIRLNMDGTWVADNLGHGCLADSATHCQPDTWERIIEDAVKLGYTDHENTHCIGKLVERCEALYREPHG